MRKTDEISAVVHAIETVCRNTACHREVYGNCYGDWNLICLHAQIERNWRSLDLSGLRTVNGQTCLKLLVRSDEAGASIPCNCSAVRRSRRTHEACATSKRYNITIIMYKSHRLRCKLDSNLSIILDMSLSCINSVLEEHLQISLPCASYIKFNCLAFVSVAPIKRLPCTSNPYKYKRYGGAITAALYLDEFVGKKATVEGEASDEGTGDEGQASPPPPAAKSGDEKLAWIHMDFMAFNQASRPGRPEGGEAQGMRALYALLEDMYGA